MQHESVAPMFEAGAADQGPSGVAFELAGGQLLPAGPDSLPAVLHFGRILFHLRRDGSHLSRAMPHLERDEAHLLRNMPDLLLDGVHLQLVALQLECVALQLECVAHFMQSAEAQFQFPGAQLSSAGDTRDPATGMRHSAMVQRRAGLQQSGIAGRELQLAILVNGRSMAQNRVGSAFKRLVRPRQQRETPVGVRAEPQ